jgi:hypothetical protein
LRSPSGPNEVRYGYSGKESDDADDDHDFY